MRVSDQLDMLSVHSLTAGALYTIIKLRSTVLHLLFTTEISLCYLYKDRDCIYQTAKREIIV